MIFVHFSTKKALFKENTGVLCTYSVIGQKSKNPWTYHALKKFLGKILAKINSNYKNTKALEETIEECQGTLIADF